MSSNRPIGVCDAILSEPQLKTQTQTEIQASPPTEPAGRVTGPVRLPLLAPELFVSQFNQIYGAIGLRLTLVQPEPADDSATIEQ